MMKHIEYMTFFEEATVALNKAESQLIIAKEALQDAGFPLSKLDALVELRNQVMSFRKKMTRKEGA